MHKTRFALALGLIFLSSGLAFSQRYEDRRRDERRQDDRRDRRERVGRTIRDCEDRTNEFKRELRRYLETSRIAGTHKERELNRDARELENRMDRVKETWERERDIPRVKHQVSRAIDGAQDLNRTMNRHRMTGDVQRAWHGVRRDLNRLAEVFDLPKLRWED